MNITRKGEKGGEEGLDGGTKMEWTRCTVALLASKPGMSPTNNLTKKTTKTINTN